ncbi:MAG: endonuclease/exonuclease/phosphatase family protein, partial [bacterium]
MGPDGPDVVVFQEVNAEEAQDQMRELLGKSKVYPAYIDLLDEHDTDNDSGLMLFSKFNFAKPDGKSFGNDESNGFAIGVSPDNSSDGVMFADEFAFWYVYAQEQTNGGDAWANKGVAFVRIKNPCEPGRPFDVVFTHMQSTGDGSTLDDYEDFVNRRDQLSGDVQGVHIAFKSVRHAIELNVDDTRRTSELIFVVGDLNINGHPHTAEKVPDCTFLTDSCSGFESYTEWEYTFSAPTKSANFDSHLFYRGFFSCGAGPCTYDPFASAQPGTFLTDAWAWETSELDMGATNSGGNVGGNNHDDKHGHRLDYFLHNRPKDGKGEDLICVQHLRRVYGFTDPKTGRDLSDHTPVMIDVNRVA